MPKRSVRGKKVQPQTLQQKLDGFMANLDRLLFSAKDKQAFLEDLATLIEDGVPANKAIDVLGRLQKKESGTKRLIDAISQKIAQGRSIAEGMVGWLPQHIVELIRAGETGGTLGGNVRVAAEALGRSNSTLASLFSSLTYPIVVLITGIFVLIYMNGSIFEQFAAIKPVSQWPSQGQQLVAIANFFTNYWLVLIIGMVVFGVAIAKLLKDTIGPVRTVIDQIPVLKVYRITTAARFMETLGLLISNGVVFKQSLRIMQSQASPYLAWHLMLMERRLSRGQSNIAQVLDTGMVSEGDVIRLMAIADAKGFEHALVRLGRQAAEDSAAAIGKFGKVLGGIMLGIGAGLAGFMVTGIYAVGSSLG